MRGVDRVAPRIVAIDIDVGQIATVLPAVDMECNVSHHTEILNCAVHAPIGVVAADGYVVRAFWDCYCGVEEFVTILLIPVQNV